MSLDVSLIVDYQVVKPKSSGIFIRENGQTKEISALEYEIKFPDRDEPFRIEPEVTTNEVFEYNITHNLNTMAQKAGIYTHLWRPDEIKITVAKELIEPLTLGLDILLADPDEFKKYNPENGWGTYELLVDFVQSYLKACIEYPEATIQISR